jgi:hypothetical protein
MVDVSVIDVFAVDLRLPDGEPVFVTALALHVIAGVWCVVVGATAAFARKRRGAHPRLGRRYLIGLSVIVATAVVMATIRWPEDAHLFAIAMVAGSLGLIGWLARRRRWAGWVRWHAIGMGGSYVALLTGFYVDNGPRLPVWNLLPAEAFWVLPAIIGTPLIWLALRRFRSGVSARPTRAG